MLSRALPDADVGTRVATFVGLGYTIYMFRAHPLPFGLSKPSGGAAAQSNEMRDVEPASNEPKQPEVIAEPEF
jgi:hypothetical protein